MYILADGVGAFQIIQKAHGIRGLQSEEKPIFSWGVAPNPTRKLFAKSFQDFQKPLKQKHFMLLW